MSRTFPAFLAALVALVLVAMPTSAQALDDVPAPVPDLAAGVGAGDLTRAEAKDVLTRARTLMRSGPPTTGPRPDLTMALRDLHLARTTLKGAERREADRLLSRETPAENALAVSAAPTLTVRCSTHFCVHHGTATTSSWAQTTLNTLEHVWSVEVPLMGRAPLTDGGAAAPVADNPDDRLDVFLQDLGGAGYYGYCTTDQGATGRQVAAFCALDDDFARSQYGAAPLRSLQVTAAHEFFHAIQFAADVTESLWFMEGSATWAEDVVYDDANDNHQYLFNSPITSPRTPLDHSAGAFPYGSFVFFTYASERRGRAVVRQFWNAAVGPRTALQAIGSVIGSAAWPAFFTTFGAWNTLPRGSYSERASYPGAVWWQRKALTAKGATTGWRTVKLPHLSNAATLLTPGAKLRRTARLVVDVDAPPRASGGTALLQRRFRDGRVTQTMIPLNANGVGRVTVPFRRAALGSAVVVLSHTKASGVARYFKVRATLR